VDVRKLEILHKDNCSNSFYLKFLTLYAVCFEEDSLASRHCDVSDILMITALIREATEVYTTAEDAETKMFQNN
jgi:hypothetical protein